MLARKERQRQTDRETDRQTGRDTETDRDRQTDGAKSGGGRGQRTHTHTHTHTHQGEKKKKSGKTSRQRPVLTKHLRTNMDHKLEETASIGDNLCFVLALNQRFSPCVEAAG